MRDETTATNDNSNETNSTRWSDERGQSAIVVISVAAALLVIIVMALADLGRGATDRARAQTAADAAALASLEGGAGQAARFAEMHGATLVSWSAGPGRDEVTVIVRFGDATATARATDAP